MRLTYRFRTLLLTCAIVLMCSHSRSQLVINEILASNAGFDYEKDYYNFADWVEIHNSGPTSVDLGNFYLSDDSDEPAKWKMPSYNLAAGGYYIVYCDKENSGRHANFGLSTEGETIYLRDASGKLIDQFAYPQQYPDISYGWHPSEPGKLVYFAIPTPGAVNSESTGTEPGLRPEFSVPAGRLDASAPLNLSGENIRYTTDGSVPDLSSSRYINPVSVNRTMTVKARTYPEGMLPGEVFASTYFRNEHSFTLPVISLSFDPEYFWDDMIGIHVRGRNGTAGFCGDNANWYQPWEREAYFEYFDVNGAKQVSQMVGVKMAGGCTRGRDQKAMSIYARGKYGDNDFDYAFFREKPDLNSFPSILLRNSGNDQDQTLLRDAFQQALVKASMNIDYQSYEPAIVYFNGDYRGIYNLREKTNEDYVATNYYLEGDIDMLERDREIIQGSSEGYNFLLDFLDEYSLSVDANYQAVASQVDIEEFINWMTVHLYTGNRDWPGNNNKYWRLRNGGKWRWLLFDLDYGFGFRMDEQGYTHESFEHATATDGGSSNPPWSTLLFRKLLENEGFTRQFLSTFLTHVYSSFRPDWCNYVLDSISAGIEEEIGYNNERWGRSRGQWYGYIDQLRTYAVNRNNFMPGYVKSFFGLGSDTVSVEISNPDPGKGKVRLNRAILQRYPVNLQTYTELPLLIEAVPAKGFQFSHWIDKSISEVYSREILISRDSSYSLELEPVFEPIISAGEVWLNELAPSSGSFRDESGEKSGFIELHNPTGSGIILRSWFLSDDLHNLTRFAIPDSSLIPAGGFLTVYADGDARQGELHTSFRLSTNGESVYLSRKIGKDLQLRDSVRFDFLSESHSFGRYEDGTGLWLHMKNMTPGKANDPTALDLTGPLKDEPVPVESLQNLRIYPNPSSAYLIVEFEGTAPAEYYLDIIDISGRQAWPRVMLNGSRVRLNLEDLNRGMYILRFFDGRRIIKAERIILAE